LVKSHAFKPSDPVNSQLIRHSEASISQPQHIEMPISEASNVLLQQENIPSQELQSSNHIPQQGLLQQHSRAALPYDHGIAPKLDVEKDIMNSSALPDSLKIGETIKLITLLDTGGQPEYITLLPACLPSTLWFMI